MTANPYGRRDDLPPAPTQRQGAWPVRAPGADAAPVRRPAPAMPARPSTPAAPPDRPAPVEPGPLLRRVIGTVLRRIRLAQGRTLRDVARAAGVSLPYLSELERGRKEPSSEVLGSICRALGVRLTDLLQQVREELFRLESEACLPGERRRSGVAGGRTYAQGSHRRTAPAADPRRSGVARPDGPTCRVRPTVRLSRGPASRIRLTRDAVLTGPLAPAGSSLLRSSPATGVWLTTV